MPMGSSGSSSSSGVDIALGMASKSLTPMSSWPASGCSSWYSARACFAAIVTFVGTNSPQRQESCSKLIVSESRQVNAYLLIVSQFNWIP